MRKKDMFSRFIVNQITNRGLLDKGNGFFHECFEGEVVAWKAPHCVWDFAAAGADGVPSLM